MWTTLFLVVFLIAFVTAIEDPTDLTDLVASVVAAAFTGLVLVGLVSGLTWTYFHLP